MKRIVKIPLIVLGILVLLALLAFHLTPLVWFPFDPSVGKRPKVISALPPPPASWQKIKLGSISMYLPMDELNAFYRNEVILLLAFSEYRLEIRAIKASSHRTNSFDPKAPFEPNYEEWIKIVNTTRDDLSFFHLPSDNWWKFANFIYKGTGQISIFRTQRIKGTIKNHNHSGGLFFCKVFSMTGNAQVDLAIFSKGEGTIAPRRIFEILGGIEIDYDPMDLGKYQFDVNDLAIKYRGKEISCKTSPDAGDDYHFNE